MREDPEIEHAERLGWVLAGIRRELTDDAALRVIKWSLERYGIWFGSGGVLHPVPVVRLANGRDVLAEKAVPVPDAAPVVVSILPPCPYCGKDDFQKSNGRTAHIRIRHAAEEEARTPNETSSR